MVIVANRGQQVAYFEVREGAYINSNTLIYYSIIDIIHGFNCSGKIFNNH